MELAGHDPHAVLGEAVARGSLHDANSVSDVLRYRIRMLDNGGRTPERAVRDGDWTTFAAPWAGPVGQYAQVLAAAATARQTELGDRAAATRRRGRSPRRPSARPRPTRCSAPSGYAAPASSRPTATCTPSPRRRLSIGEAPSRERAFHHALWRQALTALGHPADALDYATASDAELREMRDAWRRAQAWEPQFVAADLHNARELAEEYRRDAVIWRAGLDQDPVGSPERELAERDVAAAEHLAAVAAARVEALERIQDVRTDWLDRTREVQERAAFAGDELERRGLDRDTADPVGEQQELFTIGNGNPPPCRRRVAAGVVSDADAATSAAQTMRGLDPAQHQFDLDEVPPRRSRGHGFRAGGHRAPDIERHRRAPSTERPEPTARRRVAAPSRPWTTRSCRWRPRAAQRRSRPRRTGMPSCSPRPNVPPNANASSPLCSRRNPRPADVAAAQPLHLDDSPASGRRRSDDAERTEDESTVEDSTLTVSQASRQAGSSPRCVPNSTPERPPRRARPSLARPTRTTKTSTSGHPATTTRLAHRRRAGPGPVNLTRRADTPMRPVAALLPGVRRRRAEPIRPVSVSVGTGPRAAIRSPDEGRTGETAGPPSPRSCVSVLGPAAYGRLSPRRRASAPTDETPAGSTVPQASSSRRHVTLSASRRATQQLRTRASDEKSARPASTTMTRILHGGFRSRFGLVMGAFAANARAQLRAMALLRDLGRDVEDVGGVAVITSYDPRSGDMVSPPPQVLVHLEEGAVDRGSLTTRLASGAPSLTKRSRRSS